MFSLAVFSLEFIKLFIDFIFLIRSTACEEDIPHDLISDQYIKFDDIHVISAKQQNGIEDVKSSIRKTLDKYAELELRENSNESEPKNRNILKNAT